MTLEGSALVRQRLEYRSFYYTARMRGNRMDFSSEIPLLEGVVRGMVEAPLLRAA